MARVTRQRVVRVGRVQNDLLQRLAQRHPERVLTRAREIQRREEAVVSRVESGMSLHDAFRIAQ